MARLPRALKVHIQSLRASGKTYSEIQNALAVKIPKATLYYLCKDIALQPKDITRIAAVKRSNAQVNQRKAVTANKLRMHEQQQARLEKHADIAQVMKDPSAKFIALAMLYLGEGAKWDRRRGPLLSSTNPNIIRIYLSLLRQCFNIQPSDCKARVQQRSDQPESDLQDYWMRITQIPKANFYKSYSDKRTIGKPTERKGYMGVCTIMCPGTYIQLELQAISDIIGKSI